MATFIAFDMNASPGDRLAALFKATPKPSVPTPHIPNVVKSSLSRQSSVHVVEVGNTNSRPSSSLERRHSKTLRTIFSRTKISTQESIDEDKPAIFQPAAPSPAALHRQLELTAQELSEDVSSSSLTTSTETTSGSSEATSFVESPGLQEQTYQVGIAKIPLVEADAPKPLPVFSKKRLSMHSMTPRPSSATSSATSAKSPMPAGQNAPPKKRSYFFSSKSSGSPATSPPAVPTSPLPLEQSHGQPFVKALSEAQRHSRLWTSKLSVDSIITMSKWKDVSTPSGFGGIVGPKAEKAKEKLRRQISDTITKAGWVSKIYILTAGSLKSPSFILQYTPEGHHSRVPERTMQMTKRTVAFVTDAIPGRHWVLQVLNLIEVPAPSTAAATAGQKGRNRMSFKPTDEVVAPGPTAKMLLIFETADDMEEWLKAIRNEAQCLGGRAPKGETGHVKQASENEPETEPKLELKQEPMLDIQQLEPPVSDQPKEASSPRYSMQAPSDSDRGSWSQPSNRQSQVYAAPRPSEDAGSSVLSKDGKTLESLRNSDQYRLSAQFSATSAHSPSNSYSGSPGQGTFFLDDLLDETEEEQDHEPKQLSYRGVTLGPVASPKRPNAKSINERRRSFQNIQQPSPLMTEMSRPGSAGGETAHSTEFAYRPRKKSVRKGPPTALLNAEVLSVVHDQPSPALFDEATSPYSCASQQANDYISLLDPEPTVISEPKDTSPKIPPRSAKRPSLLTPYTQEQIAAQAPIPQISVQTSESPIEPPKPFDRWPRTPSATSEDIHVMYFEQPRVAPTSAPSNQAPSPRSLGRSDPFDLETTLARISPPLPPDNRYSYATTASNYTDDEASGEHGNSLAMEPNMVPLPLSPITTQPPNLQQMSATDRANQRALRLRAERASGIARTDNRDSWSMQRNDSVHKRNNSRSSRVMTGGMAAMLRRTPPKPLSSRGFINLAATAGPNESSDAIVRSPQSLTRSMSNGEPKVGKMYSTPNHRASAMPLIPKSIFSSSHIASQAPPMPQRKLSVTQQSPPRRASIVSPPATHPAMPKPKRGSRVSMHLSAAELEAAGPPSVPPPSKGLPILPPIGSEHPADIRRLNSIRSMRSNLSNASRKDSLSRMKSNESIRF